MLTMIHDGQHWVIPVMSDDVDYDELFAGTDIRPQVERNSRIEAVPGEGIRFGIYWLQPDLVARFGAVTLKDEDGKPLRTHRQAVALELRMLQAKSVAD